MLLGNLMRFTHCTSLGSGGAQPKRPVNGLTQSFQLANETDRGGKEERGWERNFFFFNRFFLHKQTCKQKLPPLIAFCNHNVDTDKITPKPSEFYLHQQETRFLWQPCPPYDMSTSATMPHRWAGIFGIVSSFFLSSYSSLSRGSVTRSFLSHPMLLQTCKSCFRCLTNSNLAFLFSRLTNGLHLVVNPL